MVTFTDGVNEYGQLGIGNTTEKYVPAKVIKSSDDLKFDLVAGGSKSSDGSR